MDLISSRKIGLHLRLQQGFMDIIEIAKRQELSIVQSFLLNEAGKYVSCSSSAIRKFTTQKKDLGFDYFVHAAYWSSLTDVASKEFLSLCKETEIALELESNGIVVHVGATKGRLSKQDQARYVAEGINELLHQVPNLPILLENGPHAGRNFGGDLNDFALLSGMIEQSGRVKFCIDTAHAFVYGYPMSSDYDLSILFKLMHEVFPKDSIALLHLNDTQHECASQIDKHGIPGQGILGASVLQKCMKLDMLLDVPIILELPGSCNDEESIAILKTVQSWNK